jgi:hypothetical protein
MAIQSESRWQVASSSADVGVFCLGYKSKNDLALFHFTHPEHVCTDATQLTAVSHAYADNCQKPQPAPPALKWRRSNATAVISKHKNQTELWCSVQLPALS